MNEKENMNTRISFISSMIRENRIEHEILSRELKKMLKEFEKRR